MSRLIDRPRPGAAVAAARGAVGLLERLEDRPQVVLVDADARVGDRQADDVGRVGRVRVDELDVRRRGVRVRRTSPEAVNLTALESRLRSTCWSRCSSV